jgi:hypothetical protein
MKTILKITAGLVLGFTVLAIAAVALLGSAVDSAGKAEDAKAASPAQVQRLHHGMKRSEVRAIMTPAKAHLVSDSDTEGLGTSSMETYDIKDGGKLFGKSVTVFYSNDRVADITKTDLGA